MTQEIPQHADDDAQNRLSPERLERLFAQLANATGRSRAEVLKAIGEHIGDLLIKTQQHVGEQHNAAVARLMRAKTEDERRAARAEFDRAQRENEILISHANRLTGMMRSRCVRMTARSTPLRTLRARSSRRARTVARVARKATATGDPDPEPRRRRLRRRAP